MKLTRRAILTGVARCVSVAALIGSRSTFSAVAQSWNTIVIGAGAFGSWTAWHLQRAGQRVLLVDAWGPAHARASSGGESRITRASYGKDEVYTRMAWDSLESWRWLSGRSGLPIFHPSGVLFFFQKREPYVDQTIEVHTRLKLPTEVLERAELRKRWPQIVWDDVELGIYEPKLGILMARRAIQTLVAEFTSAGGEYRQAAVQPPRADGKTLEGIQTQSGETLRAERYVFACGPWLPKLFPQVLGSRIFPTRQEVFFFAPPAGDARFSASRLPAWADFNEGDIYYGMPDLEARGFKIAHDRHGPEMDPDTGDRFTSEAALARVREFMRRRFPDLASRPLSESRVCQYENSSNGDLLIDRHPQWENVWLVGAGSGHGFKHAPAVGSYAAALASGRPINIEPRFSLASKSSVKKREVH